MNSSPTPFITVTLVDTPLESEVEAPQSMGAGREA